MKNDRVARYGQLLTETRSRPRQYRSGIESRIRQLWFALTDAERVEVETRYH